MTVRIPSPYGNMAGAPQELMAAYLRDPRLAMAQRSLQEGSSTAPLQGGWMEGLARLGQGLWGGYQQGQVGREYEGQAQDYRETLAAALRAKTPEEREAILGGNSLTAGDALERQMARSDRALEMEAENKAALARMGIGIRDDGTYYMLPGFGEAKGGVAAAEAGQMIPVKVKEAEAMIAPKVAEQGALMPGKVREAEGVAAAEFPYRARAAAAGRSVTNVNVDPGIQIGTIPPGYEVFQNPETGGYQARPIAGGPADLEIKAAAEKKEGAKQSRDRYLGIAGETIGRARKLATENDYTTGWLGSKLANVEGTPAYDLSKLVDTIATSVAFDRLQDMRNTSPTGGALGPVSDRETAMLRGAIANLEQSQSKKQFLENLNVVERTVDEIVNGPAEVQASPRQSPAAPPAISGDVTKMSPEEIYNELRSMDE